MAKDYGRKNKARGRHGASRPWLLVALSFLCGYLSASVFEFAPVSEWVKNKFVQKQQPHSSTKITAHHPSLPKPKFEFYTLLAKEQNATPVKILPPVETKNLNTKRASTPTVLPNALEKPVEKRTPVATNKKNTYIVQLASFRNRQDAERIKANLILKGFNVSIVSVTQQQISWYRVLIGPFTSRTQAEKAQLELARSEHMKGMIRKMDA